MIPIGLIFFLIFPASSQAEPGKNAAAFLQKTLGARAAGMGNASAAVERSPDGVQFNPALLATLKEPSFSSTYLNAFGDTNYGSALYAHPLPFSAIAGGFTYFNGGSIDLNLSNGARGTVTAEEDFLASASYAADLPFGFSVGATGRVMRMSLAETARASSQNGDLGALWETPLPGLSLGVAYQYLGPDVRFENAGDPLPRTMRWGAALRYPDADPKILDPSVDLEAFDLTAAFDLVSVINEPPSPRFGLELGMTPHFYNRIALRGGWISSNSSENLTLGLGYQGARFGFDYAFGNAPELGHLQHLTFTIYFGRKS